jgi:hypothetical protein
MIETAIVALKLWLIFNELVFIWYIERFGHE